MKVVILIYILLFGIASNSEDPFNHFTEEQKKAMQPCMAVFNDVHLCYDSGAREPINENCTEDFETGKLVCKGNSGYFRNGNDSETDIKYKKVNNSKDSCSTAFFTATTQCNGSALTRSPQAQALMNTIQSQKNVGNIKEACAAAKNLNSMSWSLNATFGLKCNSAVSRCLTACSLDSNERDSCKDLLQNVKLAQGQAIENARSYAQSQECVAAVSNCGNNSYDDPNCPQYCQKPGRQNDLLCTNQKILAQNGLQPLQQIDSKTVKDSQNLDVGTIYQPSVQKEYQEAYPEKYQEIDNSKNDLIAYDAPPIGSGKSERVGRVAGSYDSGASALPQASKSNKPQESNPQDNNPKSITVAGSVNNGSNGAGGSPSGYTQSLTSGYPDIFEEPEEKAKWYDLTRFLPLTEAQIKKNTTRHGMRFLANVRRLDWERKHPGFKKTNPNFQTVIVETERTPASNEKSNYMINRILIILFILAIFSLIYYFFIREDSENNT